MDFKQHLIHFKDNIIIKLNTLIRFISHFLAEIFVIVGLFFIVKITFKINIIAGYYTLGGMLLVIGLFLANGRR